MDILRNRKALGGAGLAVGFGLLVAWMVPPTDPHPMATNWRSYIKPVAPPAAVDFPGFAPTMAAMAAYPVQQYAYGGDGIGHGQDVTVHRGASAEVAEPPADRNDIAGPPAQVASSDAGGFAWVKRRAAVDSSICGAAPNSMVENRCRDYFAGRDEIASDDQPDVTGQEDRGED
jgi:hypothetical protein